MTPRERNDRLDTRVDVLRRSYAAGEYLDQFTTEHTPGPWIAKHENNDSVVMAGNIVIARLARRDKPQWNKANANLIAAAPDLLAACECFYRMATAYGFREIDMRREPAQELMGLAKAAIAKVKGQ